MTPNGVNPETIQTVRDLAASSLNPDEYEALMTLLDTLESRLEIAPQDGQDNHGGDYTRA